MITRILFLITLLNAAALVELAAQDATYPRFFLDGQIRHRLEVNNNDLNADTEPSAFNLLRTRVGLRFFPLEHIEGFVQVQDSRTFGEEANTLGDGDADQLDFHQAYVNISNLFSWPLDLEIGRFEALYGSQRLIGSVGWHNVGRSFDGARVSIRPDNARIDLFNLKIREEGEPGGTGDMNVYGAYGDFQLIEGYASHAFLIWQRMQPGSAMNRYTIGLFLGGGATPLKPEFELAYQGGDVSFGNVSAFMATINFGYTLSDASVQPTISAGIDLLSGDDDPTDNEYKVFDTMYATNHKFYGAMDYFLNIPVNTSGLGLRDIHVGVTLKPRDELTFRVLYHNFSSHQNLILSDGLTASRFGDEIDASMAFTYNSAVSFSGGVSWFGPGEIFEATRGVNSGLWAFLMTTVNLN